MSTRVPLTGTEKETLHARLNRHRDVALWKVDGLDDAPLRRPITPSGTTLLGLVQHLAAVELGWFCETFGRVTETLPFDPAGPTPISASARPSRRRTSWPSTDAHARQPTVPATWRSCASSSTEPPETISAGSPDRPT